MRYQMGISFGNFDQRVFQQFLYDLQIRTPPLLSWVLAYIRNRQSTHTLFLRVIHDGELYFAAWRYRQGLRVMDSDQQ